MPNPLDISSLDAWYDATYNASITQSGGQVSGWKNRVTDATPELTQTNSARYPSLNSIGPNGLQCVQFDGSVTAQTLRVSTNSIARTQPFEIWGSLQIDSNLGVVTQQVIDGVTVRARVFVASSGALSMDNSATLTGPLWPVDGLPHVFRAVSNGASSSLTIDNGVPVVGNAGTTGLDGLIVGANVGNSFPLFGCIVDLMVFNALLTTQQQNDMWTFFSRATTLQGYRRNPFSDGVNKPVIAGGMI